MASQIQNPTHVLGQSHALAMCAGCEKSRQGRARQVSGLSRDRRNLVGMPRNNFGKIDFLFFSNLEIYLFSLPKRHFFNGKSMGNQWKINGNR